MKPPFANFATMLSREGAKRELREMFSAMAAEGATASSLAPQEKELNEILLMAFHKISSSLMGGPYLDDEEIEAAALKAENLIFDEGADINCGAFTALSLAAIAGKVRFLEKLIESGAVLDYSDHDSGATTLISAATGGNVYAVYLVLKKTLEEGKIDSVNKRDQGGYAALHMAVMSANPETVKLLLLAGADPSVVSNIGETPLQIAESGSSMSEEIAERRRYIAEIIKSYPSHVGSVDKAVISRKFKELEFGKNIAVMNSAPMSGRPYPETKALIASKAEALFALCAGGIDVNTKTIAFNDPSSNEISFLSIAAKLGNADYVRRLLALGAESDSVDSFGRSVLRNAVISGNPEVVSLIFADLKAKGKKDSAFEMKDSRRSSMIIQEALESPIFSREDSKPEDVERSSEIIKILFSEIDDKNIRILSTQRIVEIMWEKFGLCKQIEVLISILPPSKAKEVVSVILKKYGLTEAVQHLILMLPEKPRAPRVVDTVASTPPPPPKSPTPEEKLERVQKELVGLLQDCESRMMRMEKYRCSAEDVAAIQNAVAKGADPNSVTENGFTILHFLARSGKDAAVRGLIARGATFSESSDGITPLDCAIDASDAKMVEIFLEFANVAQLQKSLLKAIGEKQEAIVNAITHDEKFISEFYEMEKKSRNSAIDALRRATNDSFNKKLKVQISDFAKAVEGMVFAASEVVVEDGGGQTQKAPTQTKKQRQAARAAERAALAAAAAEQKKYEEERRKINAERRAAELAAMAAEDRRSTSASVTTVALEEIEKAKSSQQEDPVSAVSSGGGGGGSGGSEPARPRLNPKAQEFVLTSTTAIATPPIVELPDWLQKIVTKITALETCTSFRLKGSALYLQYVERSRDARSAHDFDFEILIPNTANFFHTNPKAEEEVHKFVKENFGVESDAVSIFFDRTTGEFLNINIKHPSGVDFVIYDHPPKLDWSIDLDALRLEYKGNPDGPVLKFTSGFESGEDPSISYPKKTSAEYEPIINFDSYKLLQRLCFFKVIGVIDRDLVSIIPREKNCADFVFLESGGTATLLEEKLNKFSESHAFSREEKILFLSEFKKLAGRDVPTKITPRFYESFTKKVDEMLVGLGVVPSASVVPVIAAAASPAVIDGRR